MGGNPESARRLFSLGRWHDNGFVASGRDGILERKKKCLDTATRKWQRRRNCKLIFGENGLATDSDDFERKPIV